MFKILRDDFLYIAAFSGLLLLMVFILYDSFTSIDENMVKFEECERDGGKPLLTKDNVFVCVEAKREEDRK